ncbi:MAG: hypothetical protein GF317_12390 [Candidatus Lokiarchaeota archaeon]|nr:hypothetical protein [Candidatus Lokiarchaeota archaeon]MBD3200447.1 hypothetical protein [Candidatus Lokiarchaeota archaeon]
MSVELPIEGIFRAPLLLTHWIFNILCFELVFLFILKYRNKKTLKTISREIAFSILFLGISIFSMIQFNITFYQMTGNVQLSFLSTTISLKLFFNNLSYFFFILLSFLSLLIFKINSIEFLQNMLFFYLYGIFFLGTIFVFVFKPQVFLIISILNWIILIYFWIRYCLQVNGSKNKNTTDTETILLMLPMILISLGFFLSSNLMMEFTLANDFIILIGNMLNLSGILICLIIFLRDNRLLDSKRWENIEEIFVMNKQGACIFYKNLKLDKKDIDEQLISGAITSMTIVLQEMTDSMGMGRSNIQKKNKLISLYSSELITSVCISRYESNFIDYILKELVNRVETIYESTLNDWDGNTDIFLPIEFILSKLI